MGPRRVEASIGCNLQILPTRLRDLQIQHSAGKCICWNAIKKYTPSQVYALCLNASFFKMLALQFLPFQLVDSDPFCEFVGCTVT